MSVEDLMRYKVIAAFCGTGKTFLCNNFPEEYSELECWKYQNGNFPDNYINDIKETMGEVKHLFISTNPIVLNRLHEDDIDILLIYPENNLKEEYMKRYCERQDAYDFIGVMYRHWNGWLNEIKEHDFGKHIRLKRGQYLRDVLENDIKNKQMKIKGKAANDVVNILKGILIASYGSENIDGEGYADLPDLSKKMIDYAIEKYLHTYYLNVGK